MEKVKKSFFSSDWPLMGTHLVCLFLGLALSNVNKRSSMEETISPYNALIPVKNTQFKYVESPRVYSGMRVMLLRGKKDQEKSGCLESESYTKVQRKNSSFFVEAAKKDIFSYIKIFTSRNYFLIPYEQALGYELCSRKLEVSYGGS